MAKKLEESLSYPFDVAQIVSQRRQIKKLLLGARESYLKKKIAILAGANAEQLSGFVELFLLKQGIAPEFWVSDYNQFFSAALSPPSSLKEFAPDIIYVFTNHRNISQWPASGDSGEKAQALLREEQQKWVTVWTHLQKHFHAPIIQNNFELPLFRNMGNADAWQGNGRVYFINELNRYFSETAQELKNFYLLDINYLSAQLGMATWVDQTHWYSYKHPFSIDAHVYLSSQFSNLVGALYGRSKKALITDLDNTLWGGVIGDDGLEKIKLGPETPTGEAFTDFHEYIKNLSQRGIALGVCSKNEESIAKEGFHHQGARLSVEDFSSFKANWSRKDENLLGIAEDLNMGIDSFVFVDDNPSEQEVVRQSLSEVSVPALDGDVTKYIATLEWSGYFEALNISEEDLHRKELYQSNVERKKFSQSITDYSEFLKSLNMGAQIGSFRKQHYERIWQLINKTNQFNLTTKRVQYGDVVEFSENPNFITLSGTLKDKFGDNGLVSIIVGKKVDFELHIDIWLMSCRVFKRELEYAMFDCLMTVAKKENIKKIVGYYSPTPKNKIVKSFYKELGFEQVSEDERLTTTWLLPVREEYQRKNQFIEVFYESR